MVRGIDVSHHQGMIDWRRVKTAGIQFAMIRAGLGWDSDDQIDDQFRRNVEGAQAAGVPYGLYHYAYAERPEDAAKEARWFLRVVKGLRPEYPVAYDFERTRQLALPLDQQLDIIDGFMRVVEDAGYYAALYMTASSLERLWKYAPERIGRYDRWVAHVGVDKPAVSCACGMWQYSWKGRVEGIGGDVDLDFAYKDYPAIIRAAGLNGWGAPSAPTDGPQEGANLADLLASEREMRVAAESDRDAWKTKYYDLLAKHNTLSTEDGLLRQSVAELARKWPVK